MKRAVSIVQDVFGKHPETKDLAVSVNKLGNPTLNLQVVYVWNGTDAKRHAAILRELSLQAKEQLENDGIQLA